MSLSPGPDRDGSFEYEVNDGSGHNGAYGILASGVMAVRSAGFGVNFYNAAGAVVFQVSESGASFTDLNLADGTVALPSLAFINEDSTGVYRPAAGQFGVSILGTQRLNVLATGISVTGAGGFTGAVTGASASFAGIVESTVGGFKFPDASIQTSAGLQGLGTANFLAKYTAASTLAVSTIFDNGSTVIMGASVSVVSNTTLQVLRTTSTNVSARAGLFQNKLEFDAPTRTIQGVNGFAVIGDDTGLQTVTCALARGGNYGVTLQTLGIVAAAWGLGVQNSLAVAGTITTLYGLRVAAIANTVGATVTTYAAVSIEDPGALAATTYALHVEGGLSNFGGRVSITAGTDALPALFRAGDGNTGIFFPAPDQVSLTAGGLECLRAANSGGAGQVLALAGSAASPAFSFVSGGGDGIFWLLGNGATNKLGFSTGGTERMRISINDFIAVSMPFGAMVVSGVAVSPHSSLQTEGSFAAAYVSTAVDITLGIGHNVVAVDASGAARTITLPTAVGIAGRFYTVIKTDASLNAVTVDADGAETINGAADTTLLTQYATVRVVSTGAEWLIV